MHRVVMALSTGSVGDLGRLARALANADPPFDIAAVGGGEAANDHREIGIITLLIRDDDGREQEILDIANEIDHGNGRHFALVASYPALIVELDDQPGSLATCAELIGGQDINIMGIALIDLHGSSAHVGMGFADESERERAAAALAGSFEVIDHHDH